MKQENELRNAFKAFTDEDGILTVIFLQEVKGNAAQIQLAHLVEDAVTAILKTKPREKTKTLIDLTPLGNIFPNPPSEARDIYHRVLGFNPHIEKLAVVGSSHFLQFIVQAFIDKTGKSDVVHWFTDKEKALAWLKS